MHSYAYRHNTTPEKPEEQTIIDLKEPVALTFALRYLNNFAKATPLAPVVKLSLTKDLPIVVEYQVRPNAVIFLAGGRHEVFE